MGRSRRELVPAHVRDLERGSRGSIATTSPAIQPRPSTVSNSRPRSAISCMPTQMPRNGRPRAITASCERLLEPGHRGEPAPAIGEGADAGQHDAVGVGDRVGLAVTSTSGRNPASRRGALERLRRRAQIARAVIDDRNHHGRLPPSTPLVEGTAAARRGSISTAWRSARASPLKQEFDDVVVVLAVEVLDVQRDAGRLREGLEPFLEQLGVHLAELRPGEGDLPDQIGPVRDVEATRVRVSSIGIIALAVALDAARGRRAPSPPPRR